MASSRNRAWGPTHPSAAFLIKCAKEKEKLKSVLQKQLQDHMLHMLQECSFSDILIGVNSGKCYQNQNFSTHHDLPHLIHAHKPILKIRTPAFYKHIENHEETNLGISSYNSFLSESELKHFLGNVYTDDDIRRHECEALRLSRMYTEALSQQKGPINKHIPDIDEFERESVNSSCTDNFVTPKTSPITPEKKLEVSEMFNAAQKHIISETGKISRNNTASNSKTLHNGNVLANVGIASRIECQNFDFDFSNRPYSKGQSSIVSSDANDTDISIRSEDEDNAYEPLLDCSNDDTEDNDDNSEPDDLSNIGSMVRSNTFDLQTQGSLEDIADDELQWYNGHQLEDYKAEENHNFESESDNLSNKKTSSNGFFLHDHTPSPKTNIFKHGFMKEVSFSDNHDLDNSAASVHYRRTDGNGSLTDSGFMSHSTFSLLSDAGLASSVSSSLILSADGALSPSIRSTSTGNDVHCSESDGSKRFSGSMFPFYIDINNLPPGSPDLRKEKKSSPTHTYMYIDARSKTNTENGNEIIKNVRKQSPVNSSYEAFFSELEAGFGSKAHEPLMKASSTPHLDLYKEMRSDSSRGVRAGQKARPQSCYMYIDLDSLKDDRNSHKKNSVQQASSSVSMFIDLNESSNKNSCSDVKQMIRQNSENLNLTNFSEIKNMKDSKTAMEKINRKDDQFIDQKLKLMDSSITENLQRNYDMLKSRSLTRQREIKSASALDCRIVNFQEIAAQSKLITHPEKSYSAHRYSDGIVYDKNLHCLNFSSTDSLSAQEEKLLNDAKNMQIKDTKLFNQTVKLQLLSKNEESSGSCSNLGKDNINAQLLADDKVKWKSTGDMGQSKEFDSKLEGGLLPMSPILRRKVQSKAAPKSAPPPVIVKASTKPQDIDAMTFPISIREDGTSVKTTSKESICSESIVLPLSPLCKIPDLVEGSKSSSDSLKLVNEGVVVSSDSKKNVNSLSRSGSSVMTLSGGDTSSSDKNITHEIIREKKNVDSMSRSGSSLMTVSGGDTSSSDKNISHDISKEKFPQSSSSMAIPFDLEDDSETIYSEVSDVSSSLGGIGGVASLERRWRETQSTESDCNNQNEENSRRILEACSKLGEDLLRMFLEEIDTDIKIEVAGHQIRAHRCILVSRCKYFASLLRGSDSRKNCSTISLEGFSQISVHFALCHIYSGAMNIPKDCNISELALLADMLNLGSLTDVIVFHLKMHFCHFFHRPCPQCIQGVVECLPLAAVCGLNELRDKCIFWLGKYFTRTWPNKTFAALSEELRNLCYNITVQHLAVDTVIEMTLNCDRLMTTLPQLKWTEPIFGMVTKLLQDCIHFMAKNFSQILCSEGFLTLGKGQSWNITALEEDIISSVELTTPDVACKSFAKVNQLLLFAESDENSECGEFTQNFVDLLHKISRHCERYLIQNANKVVHCQSWACLSPQVQKRIKDAAVIVFEFEKPTAPPPRLSSLNRKLKKQNDPEEICCLERSTYPKKGRGIIIRKLHRDNSSSPKNSNAQYKSENAEGNIYQRREMESLIKKIVSPIKEEVQSSSIDQSLRDISHDMLSGALSECESPIISHISHNRGYIDMHEEDSLRDLQDLPRDHSQSPSQCLKNLDTLNVCNNNEVENRSSAHCSDNNPDSLEVNEELSLDDGTNGEINKELEDSVENLQFRNMKLEEKSPDRKSKSSILEQNKNVPMSHSVLPYEGEKHKHDQADRDKSPVKKSLLKSLVPLAKSHEEKSSSESRTKDLVAEIDADSRMVNHCLQEAEMLEQQLSRKLQRQHQDRSPNHYAQNNAVEHHRSSRTAGSRLQKASSTSQIKNLSNTVGVRSPGRVSKSTASSPSIGHAPRLLRSSDLSKEQKYPQKKVSLSPKGNPTSVQKSFKSMENMANVQRQISVPAQQLPKRVSSRSSRTKVPNIINVRTSVPNAK